MPSFDNPPGICAITRGADRQVATYQVQAKAKHGETWNRSDPKHAMLRVACSILPGPLATATGRDRMQPLERTAVQDVALSIAIAVCGLHSIVLIANDRNITTSFNLHKKQKTHVVPFLVCVSAVLAANTNAVESTDPSGTIVKSND